MGVGLAALLLVDLLDLLPPLFLKRAVDVSVPQGLTPIEHPLETLKWIALGYLGVSLIQGIGRYGWRMYLLRASLLTGRDVRAEYTHHLFRLSMSFFDRRRIGDLMSLAISDTEAVRMALGVGVLIFADALIGFTTIPVAMYLLSPRLTFLALAPLLILPVIVYRNEREIHNRYGSVQDQFSRISALVQEGLNGIRVVKAFAKEPAQIERIRSAGQEYVDRSLYLAQVQTAFGPTLDFMMSLAMVLLLFVGGRSIIDSRGQALTLGVFVAFQRYIQKMVWPMAAVGMAMSYYQRALTSSDRLKEVLAIQPDVPESETPRLPAEIRGEVEFRKLRFKFPGTDRYVLEDITLKIRPGERVAFIGAIGAGKSALLSLLPRLYPVERGMLFIDGVDVNDWPLEELRRQVGYVSQDIFLFSETVSENVAFSFIERGNDIPSIEQATQLAAVHEDVLGLTSSYATRLGERGVNLSGGQKQRLTIARALAKQPRILVLDDALSSVDVQTEEKILSGLAARPNRNTEIIAAHRISTIREADRIVVLEGGVIRQMGNHEELIQDRRGHYRSYYEQQQLRDELEHYAQRLDP